MMVLLCNLYYVELVYIYFNKTKITFFQKINDLYQPIQHSTDKIHDLEDDGLVYSNKHIQ